MSQSFPKIKISLLPFILRRIFGNWQQIRGVPRLLYTLRDFVGNDLVLVDTPDGLPITIHPQDYAELMLFYFPYCLELRTLLVDLISPNDLVFDIGANVGLLSLAMAELVGKDGLVVAVEPNPSSIRSIQATVEYCDLKQIKVVQAAVGQEIGTAYLQLNPSALSISAEINNTIDKANGQAVQITTIDHLIDFYCSGQIPNFIKVDIEGSEVELLSSMQTLISSDKRPMLLLEYHREKCLRRGVSPETIRQQLLELGYKERCVRLSTMSYQLIDHDLKTTEHDNFLYVTDVHLKTHQALQAKW